MSIIEKAAGKLASVKSVFKAEQFKRVEPQVTKHIEQEKLADQVQVSHVQRQSKFLSVDLNAWQKLGGVMPNEEKTKIAEEFRLIKRPLLTNAFDKGAGRVKNGNLIMVTSALAGEGKSFCAINLAMSIAMEKDHTVLLIDGDVARPTVPKYLNFTAGSGLLDVLDDKVDLSDVMMKTNVEKLTIIPSGKRSRSSTELLASQSMSNLLKDIAQRYSDRVIIFDSPPLLLTTESQVLATQMGQIVMVVEAEETPQKVVKSALRQIETCDVVNLVYNKSQSLDGGGYYGYGYGYGYN